MKGWVRKSSSLYDINSYFVAVNLLQYVSKCNTIVAFLVYHWQSLVLFQCHLSSPKIVNTARECVKHRKTNIENQMQEEKDRCQKIVRNKYLNCQRRSDSLLTINTISGILVVFINVGIGMHKHDDRDNVAAKVSAIFLCIHIAYKLHSSVRRCATKSELIYLRHSKMLP